MGSVLSHGLGFEKKEVYRVVHIRKFTDTVSRCSLIKMASLKILGRSYPRYQAIECKNMGNEPHKTAAKRFV
jgi:hypothetical protein